MPKKKVKKTAKKKQTRDEAPDGLVFREKRLIDFNLSPKHPKPIPGHKATLPGPPGWQCKENPGA
jgi:hypothetical protein